MQNPWTAASPCVRGASPLPTPRSGCGAPTAARSAFCLALPLSDDAGNWNGARGVCRDVTDIRERDIAIARARNRERLLSFIVRSFRDEVDPENMLAIAAATVAQGVGVSGCNVLRTRDGNGGAPLSEAAFSVAAAFGRTGEADDMTAVVRDFCAGQDVVEAVLGKWNVLAAVTRYRQGINGAIVLWRELSRVPYDDDRILLSDLSAQVGIAIEQISNHEHILALSRTDSLTGLFNRRAFIEELERRTARLRHERRKAALVYVDLDNFKMVNDIHGHKRGDEALMEVKRLLLAATRPTDLVARLGGDEFAIWMDGADEAVAVGKARRLLAQGSALEGFSGSVDRVLSMSLGIAVYEPESEESIDALLSRADTGDVPGQAFRQGILPCRAGLSVRPDEGKTAMEMNSLLARLLWGSGPADPPCFTYEEAKRLANHPDADVRRSLAARADRGPGNPVLPVQRPGFRGPPPHRRQ